VYTPLKRTTRWATEVGSVSGALPPLLGAAAAGDPLSAPAWLLAAVLLFWQMPHFYAIGWRYRSQYQAAGLPLLPVVDPDGRRTSYWATGYTAALVAVSLLPWLTGSFGAVYGVPAATVGVGLLGCCIGFIKGRPDRTAA